MNPVFRKVLFRFLSLVFVVFVPILVFLVLGFDFNFQQKKLVNSMEVTVETLPRNANITNFGQKVGLQTPVSLKTTDGSYLDFEISRENFLTERFGFIGQIGQNTNIQISNLWLLPNNSQTVARLQESGKNLATGSPIKENLTILPEVIFWTTNTLQNQNLLIQKLPLNSSTNSSSNSDQNSSISSNNLGKNLENQNQNEVQSENKARKEIQSETQTETKIPNSKSEQTAWVQNYTTNGISNPKKVNKIGNRLFENTGKWQNSGKSYWNKIGGWILFEQENEWNLVDLQIFPPIKQLIRNSNWQFLVLDNSDTLWLWDSQINANFTPNNSNSQNQKNSLLTNSIQNQNANQNGNGNSNISQNSNQINNSNQSSQTSGNSKESTTSQTILENNSQENSKINSNNFVKNPPKNSNLGLKWQFLESSVCQMSFLENSQSVWFWHNSQIFRSEISKINENLDNWNLGDKFWAKLPIGQSCGKFEVKNLSQGTLFLVNQKLLFLPDSDRQNWLILANFVDSFNVFEENLFWQSGVNLYNYNLITKNEKYLGTVNLQNTKLFYDLNWRRLMIYGQEIDGKNSESTQQNSTNSMDRVWSVWFDKFNPSTQNIVFYPKIWLQNPNCLSKIQDQLQFCLEDDKLITYGNFRLF